MPLLKDVLNKPKQLHHDISTNYKLKLVAANQEYATLLPTIMSSSQTGDQDIEWCMNNCTATGKYVAPTQNRVLICMVYTTPLRHAHLMYNIFTF